MKIALIVLFISWLIKRGCRNYITNDITAKIRYSAQKGFIFWFTIINSMIHTISLIVVVITLIFKIF